MDSDDYTIVGSYGNIITSASILQALPSTNHFTVKTGTWDAVVNIAIYGGKN